MVVVWFFFPHLGPTRLVGNRARLGIREKGGVFTWTSANGSLLPWSEECLSLSCLCSPAVLRLVGISLIWYCTCVVYLCVWRVGFRLAPVSIRSSCLTLIVSQFGFGFSSE